MEARLSQPELSTIMELADFFDTSVDALLGFEFRDNRLSAQAARLREYCITHDRSGLQEAEKALKKYPHTFDIMYGAANLYFVFATESHDERLCPARTGTDGRHARSDCAEHRSKDQ